MYYTPSLVNVMRPTARNVYTYSPMKLWLAYGLAILFSTLASIIGLTIIAVSGASCSDNFSNIFRVARGTYTTVASDEKDFDGRDPLPDYISDLTICLKSRELSDDKAVLLPDFQQDQSQAMSTPRPVQRRYSC